MKRVTELLATRTQAAFGAAFSDASFLAVTVKVTVAVIATVAVTVAVAASLSIALSVAVVQPAAAQSASEPVLESSLEVFDITTGERSVVYRRQEHFEAPNWSTDGSYFIFNQGGLIYRLPVEGGEPTQIDTGDISRCNNDHGITADGETLIVSCSSEAGTSIVYTLPIEGGTPTRITEHGPSYWHGVSPIDNTLAYVGMRDGDYDIYTIPFEGGEETQLTTAPGLDDGPDYSPDGQYIYFNSVRTGTMQIYRMDADGSNEVALTDDAYNDWFPHPSPDGQWLVFVSYEPDVEGHPANRDVMLRIMPADGSEEPRVLTRLFGGQGTINVPSWHPDSERFAFVSYRLLED